MLVNHIDRKGSLYTRNYNSINVERVYDVKKLENAYEIENNITIEYMNYQGIEAVVRDKGKNKEENKEKEKHTEVGKKPAEYIREAKTARERVENEKRIKIQILKWYK